MTDPAPSRKTPSIENAVAGGQIDRKMRARSDRRSSNVANDSFAREADAVLSPPASPIQIFHIEEIVLGHETDVFDECSRCQNTRAAYRIDPAKVLNRWCTASWRIP